MQFITTTELRTKSKELVRTLKEGRPVELIHRSQVVGEIKPKDPKKPFTIKDIKQLQRLSEAMNLSKLSYKARDKRLRKILTEKYGQDIS